MHQSHAENLLLLPGRVIKQKTAKNTELHCPNIKKFFYNFTFLYYNKYILKISGETFNHYKK